MDYKTFALGRDLSSYDEVNINQLRGLDFLHVRIGGSENDKYDPVLGNPYRDPKAMKYIQMAWDLDIPCFVTWFIGPRVYKEEQISEADLNARTDAADPVMSNIWHQMYSGTALRGINGLFTDYEEQTYYCYAPWKVEDYWVRVYMENIRNRYVKRQKTDALLAKTRFGTYSRRTFVDEHDNNPYSYQQYVAQHPEYDLWTANWPRIIPKNISVADLRANWLPDDTWTAKSFAFNSTRERTWTFWQFVADPDYDLFNGTVEDLHKWCNYVSHGAAPVTETPPPYLGNVKVNIDGLRMRTEPSNAKVTTIIKSMPIGTPLKILSVTPDAVNPANLWGTVTINAYVAVKWNGDDYVLPE